MRPDGRQVDQVRTIVMELDWVRYAEGSVLYRAATEVSAQQAPAMLRLLPHGKRSSRLTGVRLDLVGNQWAWLHQPVP